MKKLLIFLGLRTRCCFARKVYVFGWDWKEDGYVCAQCGNRV